MPKLWQVNKTPPFGRRKDRSGPLLANISTEVSPISSSEHDWTKGHDQTADSPPYDSPVSPLTTPLYETPSTEESPLSFLDQHTLFSPGWSFDVPQGQDSPSYGRAAGRAPDTRPHAIPLSGPPTPKGEATRRPKQFHRQASANLPAQSGASGNASLAPPSRPLRSVASSPALNVRKDSKVALPISQVHPAFRSRNVSYDSPAQGLRIPKSTPRSPPPDKPLPAIPIESRQPATGSVPPTLPAIPSGLPNMSTSFSLNGTSVEQSAGYDRRRDPPPYVDPPLKYSAERTMSDGDTLSTRTRIVMDVLGHMVALLRTRDEVSLLEFSSLVTAQTKDMQFRAELESTVRF